MDEEGHVIQVGKTCLARPGLKVIGVPVTERKRGRKPKAEKDTVKAKKAKVAPVPSRVAPKKDRDRGAEVLKTAVTKKTGEKPAKVNVVKEDDKKARDKKLDELLSDI
jgi:hypothetical protein